MRNKSFTLIELLVVIVIIGILAGVIIVSTSSSINKANFAKAQAFSNTVQQELLLNLVSEWTFDEGDARDTWGNNDGTLMGANGLPQIQTKENCVYGTCYLFDGVDDYIEIADNQELRLVKGGTIASWIYVDDFVSGGYGRILDKSTGNDGQNGYVLYVDSQLENISYKSNADSATRSVNNSIKKNTWQFIVVLINNSSRKIYIDGLDKTGSSGGTMLPPDVALNTRIGNRCSALDRPFNGSIDDVRIYNAALSTSQIKQEYIAGLNSLLANNSISKEEYDQRLNNLAYDKE